MAHGVAPRLVPTAPSRRPRAAVAARTAALAAGLAALAAAVAGCLFEPRSAETPGGQTIIYVPANDPRAVMENLQTALNARDVAGYQKMLAEDFAYVPDGQTSSEYPDIDWPNWNQEKEIQFAGDLFNSVTTVQAALQDSTIFAPVSGSAVEWELIYSVQITSPGATQPTPYRGRAFFKMALYSTVWALSEWRDIQGEPPRGGGGILPTAGILRGAIARGGG